MVFNSDWFILDSLGLLVFPTIILTTVAVRARAPQADPSGNGIELQPILENIDECEDHQCQSGTCVDRVNGYDCQCDLGFEGDFCQIDIDECQNNQCQRGRSETDNSLLLIINNCQMH